MLEKTHVFCHFQSVSIAIYWLYWLSGLVKGINQISTFLRSFWQKQILQLKSWRESLEKMKTSHISENGVLCIDASQVQRDLIPKLDNIFGEIISMLTQKIVSETERLFSDLNKYIKVTFDFFF